jgi:hypothetical protein
LATKKSKKHKVFATLKKIAISRKFIKRNLLKQHNWNDDKIVFGEVGIGLNDKIKGS